MIRRILRALGAGALLAASAAAFTPVEAQNMPPPRAGLLPGAGQPGFVRVQSTLNFFVPGPTGDSAEAVALRERARKAIYDAAARECELLRATLANDCRLESVNSSINAGRTYGPAQPEGFTVNGSMSFQITLK